jgi:hypothetical protein
VRSLPPRTPEIARRFGIAESSVYRVAQRHGALPRGRPPARAQPEHEVSSISAAPVVRLAPAGKPDLSPQSPQPTRAPTGAARRPGGAVSPGMPKAAGGGTRPFRVRFQAEGGCSEQWTFVTRCVRLRHAVSPRSPR